MTTQGMKEAEMAEVGDLITRALRSREDDAALAQVRADVATLCAKFTPYS